MRIDARNIRELPKPGFVEHLSLDRSVAISGIDTQCFVLSWDECGEEDLDEWALHIRRHYLRDDELKQMLNFLGEEAPTYLSRRIPDHPRIMGGDFAEIVISDLVQWVDGYVVPRYKQHRRKDKNSSEHGTDVLAYKLCEDKTPCEEDVLLLVEVKSSANSPVGSALSSAGEDFGKDHARCAMTIDYYLEDSLQSGDFGTAKELKRFESKGESSYTLLTAVGIANGSANLGKLISGKAASDYGIQGYDKLIFFNRPKLMELIRDLYGRCVQ